MNAFIFIISGIRYPVYHVTTSVVNIVFLAIYYIKYICPPAIPGSSNVNPNKINSSVSRAERIYILRNGFMQQNCIRYTKF